LLIIFRENNLVVLDVSPWKQEKHNKTIFFDNSKSIAISAIH